MTNIPTSRPRQQLWPWLLLLWLLSAPALAHPMDEWFAEFRWTTGQGLQGRLRVPADQRAKLEGQPIIFENGGQPLSVEWKASGTDADGRVQMDLSATSADPASNITIKLPAGLLDANQSLIGFLSFDGSDPTTVMIPASGSGTFAPVQPQLSLGEFFQLGVKHIIEGYDHLLFLFCLLIAGGTLRHLIIVVTAFTVGHSLTLALSVLGLVSVPSKITESLIAFSIIVAALSNLWLPNEDSAEETGRKTAVSRGLMAGFFGLIHGLGFASMLLDSGLAGTNVAIPLVGFNLGVEAGQLVLVLISYPILRAIHRSAYRRPFIVTSSILGALLGLFWMLERLEIIS